MIRVAGVRFKQTGKIYYFSPAGLQVERGDRVVAETARGPELGEVVVRPKDVPEDDVSKPLRNIMRKATDDDRQRADRNRGRSSEAYRIALDKIRRHGLEMKLVDVEFAFDGRHTTCYFTAEERVDFRALVRDLAKTFRNRIEMRQIGVRDEAKMLGGYGLCGRPLCCSTWIADFEPISIRHAKEQELSLNPGRISGACGRLKCCLKYEADMYREMREALPKVGETVHTSQGSGKVVDVHVIKESVTVVIDPQEGRRVEVKATELQSQASPRGDSADESESKGSKQGRSGRRRRRRSNGQRN